MLVVASGIVKGQDQVGEHGIDARGPRMRLRAADTAPVEDDEATQKPASLGNTGRAIVAIDTVGAGEGQLVLVVQGSSARMTEQTKNLPADAVIVGIVDSAEYAGKTFYQSGTNH